MAEYRLGCSQELSSERLHDFCHAPGMTRDALTPQVGQPTITFKEWNGIGRSMDAYDPQARLFRTLMHPARLGILDILRSGEACVCHLEAALGYRQAYISQQLMVLRDADLVEDRRDGLNIYYRVVKPWIFDVMDSASAALGKRVKSRRSVVAESCACPNCASKVVKVAG